MGVEVLLADEPRAPWWKWALLTVSTAVLVTAVTLLGVVGLAYNGVDFLDYVFLPRPPYILSAAVAFWLAFLIVGQTAAPLLVLLGFRHSRRLLSGGLSLPEDGPGALLRVLWGALLLLLLQVAWSLTGLKPAEHWRVVEHLVYAAVGGGHLLAMAVLAAAVGVVGPVVEEVLFRGAVRSALRRRWGTWAGVVGSAVLFGLAHGPTNAIPTAVFGLYLAWQAEKDGSLVGPIALHVLNNMGALVAISAGLGN